MLQTIYWILAIIVMILLLINIIKTDKEYTRFIKKQEAMLDKQDRDMEREDK